MFKPIPNFPNYLINRDGVVKDLYNHTIIKSFERPSGLSVCIRDYRNCRITKSIKAMLKQVFPTTYIDYLDTKQDGYNKEISLTKLREVFHYDPSTGEVTLLSDEVVIYNSPKVYKSFRWNKAMYLLHHVIYFYQTGHMVDISNRENIDHIDHNRANNKWDNLRLVDLATNSKNLSKFINNTSGVTGVVWVKNRKKWGARIRVNGKDISLGNYHTLEEAAKARKAAEIKYGFHENHGS